MLKRTCLLATLAGLALQAHAAPEDGLKEIVGWLNGTYDNGAQINAQQTDGVSAEDQHRFVEVQARPVEMPDAGQYNVQVEYRDLGNEGRVFRRRIYGFSAGPDEQVITLRLYIPRAGDALAQSLELGEAPSIDDFIVLPGCDIYLQQQAGAWRGSMAWGACRYAPLPGMNLPEEVTEVVSFTRMAIEPKGFHFSDTLYDGATEAVLFQTGDGTLHHLRRRSSAKSVQR